MLSTLSRLSTSGMLPASEHPPCPAPVRAARPLAPLAWVLLQRLEGGPGGFEAGGEIDGATACGLGYVPGYECSETAGSDPHRRGPSSPA